MRPQRRTLVLTLVLAAICLPASRLAGQSDKPAASFGISFSGYVKTDIFYDSRRTVNIREGHYLLFPKEPALDPLSRDVNAKSSFNILSI
ncbi:MAG TPA: hypothetical protein VEG35_06740 [Burkholderiales bacterium]|nr:hypothetical protein [Burkholderiales bacterium]